jgi:phosphonoacetate hydrolase
MVHTPAGADLTAIRNYLFSLPGVTEVYSRDEAAVKLQLPADRLGELIVCAGRNTTLGRTTAYHDLSVLRGGLRSHGGRYEEMVPFIFSEPLSEAYASKLLCDPRNFDLFDFLINGTRN